jgi:hypothetical protein
MPAWRNPPTQRVNRCRYSSGCVRLRSKGTHTLLPALSPLSCTPPTAAAMGPPPHAYGIWGDQR